MAIDVSVPWPLSGLWMISVTTSSVPMRMNAFGVISAAAGGRTELRVEHRLAGASGKIEADQQSAVRPRFLP